MVNSFLILVRHASRTPALSSSASSSSCASVEGGPMEERIFTLHLPHCPKPPQSPSNSTSVFWRASKMLFPRRTFNQRSSGKTLSQTCFLFCFLSGGKAKERRLFFFFLLLGFFIFAGPMLAPASYTLQLYSFTDLE